MGKQKVALVTAGGLAPCLASSIAELIIGYTKVDPEIEIVGYMGGYKGLLTGESITVTPRVREKAHVLHQHGGSPLGNSRIKLSIVEDCVRRGLIEPGEVPLDVAAERLARDGVTILHTIGGDGTAMAAAELVRHLERRGIELTVVGLPKTVDNDIMPIRQSLGALTAAEQGAIFFENFGSEQSAAPRTLLIHEIMGRHSGWLAAATARNYRERLMRLEFLPEFNVTRTQMDIDAVYIPEVDFDLDTEAERLARVMDRDGCVSIFVSEGTHTELIAAEMEARGEKVHRDPFGYIALHKINIGRWLGNRLSKLIGAERTLVEKSGYFARSAAANQADRKLIAEMAQVAIEASLRQQSGVVGHDMERGDELHVIGFDRIERGKPFDPGEAWFGAMLDDIGQPKTGPNFPAHQDVQPVSG